MRIMLQDLIARKETLFPENTRTIIDVEVTPTKDSFYIVVKSTLPDA